MRRLRLALCLSIRLLGLLPLGALRARMIVLLIGLRRRIEGGGLGGAYGVGEELVLLAGLLVGVLVADVRLDGAPALAALDLEEHEEHQEHQRQESDAGDDQDERPLVGRGIARDGRAVCNLRLQALQLVVGGQEHVAHPVVVARELGNLALELGDVLLERGYGAVILLGDP